MLAYGCLAQLGVRGNLAQGRWEGFGKGRRAGTGSMRGGAARAGTGSMRGGAARRN